jgi:hypothetical protein
MCAVVTSSTMATLQPAGGAPLAPGPNTSTLLLVLRVAASDASDASAEARVASEQATKQAGRWRVRE